MSMTITLSPVSHEIPFANYAKASDALDQIINGNTSLDPLSIDLIKCATAAQLEIVNLRVTRAPAHQIAALVEQHLQELRKLCVGLDGSHPLKEDPVVDCGAVWERSEHRRHRLILGTFGGQPLSENPQTHMLSKQVLVWLRRCAPFDRVVSAVTEETSLVPVNPAMEKMLYQLVEKNVLLARRNRSLQGDVNQMGERLVQVMDGQHALSESSLHRAKSEIQKNELVIQQRIASFEQMTGIVIADLTARIDSMQKAHDEQSVQQQKTTSTLCAANKESEARWQSQIAQLRAERESVVSGLRAKIEEERGRHEQSNAVLSTQVQAIAVSSHSMMTALAKASDTRIAGLEKQIEQRPPLPEELQLQAQQLETTTREQSAIIKRLNDENQQLKGRVEQLGREVEDALDDDDFCVIQ